MRSPICVTSLLLLIFSASGLSQERKSLSQQSYEHARRVLDQGLKAIGDAKSLESLGDIQLKYSAKAVEFAQSANPDAPSYITQANGTRILDFRGKRIYQELDTYFLGGIPLRLKEVVTEKGGFTIELTSNAVYPIATNSVAGSMRSAQSLFPQYVLATALNRASTLRWIGMMDYEGRKQMVVSFSPGDFQLFTMYFDAQTHSLTRYESLTDNTTVGVATYEVGFKDYRGLSDVKIPFRVVTRFAGMPSTDLNYIELKIGTHPDNSLFEMPKGLELGPETGGQLSLIVTKLAPAVYYINNGLSARGNFCLNNIFFYSQMLVVLKDYVVVIEAPRSDSLSQAVIAKIKEVAPGKPIKYVALTHYHSDHLGGVRGYIAEGATVLTTPGNKRWIERIASMPLPFNPDTLSRNPRSLNIETFADKRVVTDGEQTVELYNIGSPHADEMVIAYLPKEKIAFASDIAGIFAFQPAGQVMQANLSNVDFVKKIEKLGLRVEMIASGHGRILKMDELRKAVSLRAANNR